MDYRGETFRDCEVRLDHNKFHECRFENAVLHYGGGPFVLDGCVFANNTIQIDGSLWQSFLNIRELARTGGRGSIDGITDMLAAFMAEPPTKETFRIG